MPDACPGGGAELQLIGIDPALDGHEQLDAPARAVEPDAALGARPGLRRRGRAMPSTPRCRTIRRRPAATCGRSAVLRRARRYRAPTCSPRTVCWTMPRRSTPRTSTRVAPCSTRRADRAAEHVPVDRLALDAVAEVPRLVIETPADLETRRRASSAIPAGCSCPGWDRRRGTPRRASPGSSPRTSAGRAVVDESSSPPKFASQTNRWSSCDRCSAVRWKS